MLVWFLTAHPRISCYLLIALCQLKSTQCTCLDHSQPPLCPPTSLASLLIAHIVGPLFQHPATWIGNFEHIYCYVMTVWSLHLQIQIILWWFCTASGIQCIFWIWHRGIIFIVSTKLSMHIRSCGTLTDTQIAPKIALFSGLEDLASFLAAHPRISCYLLIALCQLKSSHWTCLDCL